MDVAIDTLAPHPAHGRYVPALDEKDYCDLRDSIAAVGLLHPLDVWVHDSTVLLDGTHRLRALRELGYVQAEARLVETDDPEGYIYTVALQRRHLTDSQRAAMASLWAEAHTRQGERTDLTSPQRRGEVRSRADMHPTEQAATAVHSVTRRAHDKATFVRERDPALLGKVRDGEVPLRQAYKQTKKADEAAKAEEAELPFGTAPAQVPVAFGEWWQLGDHLLYCGDSNSEEFIAVLREAAPIPFAFADPPYGSGKDEWDTAFSWAHDYLAEVAAVVAVTPGNWNLFDFARQTAMPYAWTFTCWINNGMTRGSMGFGNTILVPLFASGSVHCFAQDFMQTSLRNADTEETTHRTRKPAGLLTKLIGLYSGAGDVVADPFLGSGTTLWAADALGRKCIGADIEPAYCAEIIARWQAKSGRQAVRQ